MEREVCEELRKKRVDACCLHDMRWKGSRMLGIDRRRFLL